MSDEAACDACPSGPSAARAVEDLFWALLNTPEFSFVD